jgi:fido (protein-threonine AMPylation protein)
VTLPWQTRGLQRVIGVARPLADGAFAIGDAASPEALPVAGVGDAVARGTPIEVVGRWNGGRRIVECRSLATIGQVPDYPGICAAVENLCARAGLAAEPMQLRLRPPGELDQSVVQARDKRRLGEWDATLAAAELLDHALSAGQLSLEALARVHAIVVGASSARAGQLRQTPAVIRWCGVITCRTPPVPAARSQARGYLSDLAAELCNGASARHPATLAAEAIAFLTASHPFADGNGRVSRALATWLLLRSGFRRRADNTLGTFLDAHLDEHYRALRNFRVSPWGWHQLFYDAVLATFERAPAPVAVMRKIGLTTLPVSESWMASLIKQSDLRNASIAGDMTSILRNGRLGEIDRFTLYYSNLLPTGDTSGTAYSVFFGVPAALTFAAQFTKMETIRSERSFSNLVRGLQVYGFKVVTAVAMGRAWAINGLNA